MNKVNKNFEEKRNFIFCFQLPKFIAIILFFIFYFLFSISSANAASLYFYPSTNSCLVGQEFTASVYVSSPDQAMNAVSGVVSFPSDKLEVSSLSKTGSIISIWTEEPSFSNSTGTINFEGVALNPGFTGAVGKVISIVFKVKAPGTSTLSFSSGSVLANDGNGTDILSGTKTASFSLNTGTTPQPPPTPPPANTPSSTEAAGLPGAPVISSSTNPDPEEWYSNSTPEFSWNLSSDTSAIKILYDGNPNSVPRVLYAPPISEKDLTGIKDGIHYFHVQFSNANGWGPISNFKFQIDTQKPTEFNITQIQPVSLTDPNVKFTFDAQDQTSGIDHYEVYVDDPETSESWIDDGSHVYQTTASSGKHVLVARAVDRAGNYLANFAEFTIYKVEPPTITYYPRELQAGEVFAVEGKTMYPNADVSIYLQKRNGNKYSWVVKSDENGNFVFTADKRLDNGDYELWATNKDANGLSSGPTVKMPVLIGFQVLLKLGQWNITIIDIIVILSVLILVLLAFLIYMHYKFKKISKKVSRKV
jgi:hypothetical protein